MHQFSQSVQEKQEKEEKEILDELAEEKEKGEIVEVTNEKTGVVHRFNTKTLRDQFGTLPTWKKPRNTERKIRKKQHAQKKQFNQAWLNKFVPLQILSIVTNPICTYDKKLK